MLILSPLSPTLLRCSTGEGLCLCRPHLPGRRCHELQSGHFCAALDQATAKAKLGQGLQPADLGLPMSVQEGQGKEKTKAQTLGLMGRRECPKRRLAGLGRRGSAGEGVSMLRGLVSWTAPLLRTVWERAEPECRGH